MLEYLTDTCGRPVVGLRSDKGPPTGDRPEPAALCCPGRLCPEPPGKPKPPLRTGLSRTLCLTSGHGAPPTGPHSAPGTRLRTNLLDDPLGLPMGRAALPSTC